MTDALSQLLMQHAVEQFYIAEASMLDERRFLAWVELFTDDANYAIPARHARLGDMAHMADDAFHAVERELSAPDEAPFRDEGRGKLTLRAQRALAPNAWAENPPVRTSRFISNVQILSQESDGDLKVQSKFILSYSHLEANNHVIPGRREDLLRPYEGSFRIAKRRIIFDWNVITAPTLALFF